MTNDLRLLSNEVTVLAAAASWASDIIRQIPDDAWEGPGLGDWDIRALVGHTSRALLTIEQYMGSPADSEDVQSAAEYYEAAARLPGAGPADIVQRGTDAGAALGNEPARMFADIVERVLALLDDAGDDMIRTIVGGIRLSNYLPTRTFELTVHGLDITRATGLAESPPQIALRHSLDLATQIAVLANQGPALLLALTGRSNLDDDFSVL